MDSAFLKMWDIPSSVIFCSSWILVSPGIFWIYLSIPFFISPKAPIATGIVVAFIPHIRSILISRSLYLDSFSVIIIIISSSSSSSSSSITIIIIVIVVYMKKLLDCDWLRVVQFKCNTSTNYTLKFWVMIGSNTIGNFRSQ